jgi:hypothetical protein
MTRASNNRIEQRLKRKGTKPQYDAGYAKGWAHGRLQLANALASPEGFVAADGTVFRMTSTPPPVPVDPEVTIEPDEPRDDMQQFGTPGEDH